MQKTGSVTIDAELLKAAETRAADQGRSLTDYLERLVKLDLGLITGNEVEVINAGDAGEFVPDRMRGETAEEYEERKAMLATLLSGGGN
ncbi:MAG: hypothetical protein CL558_09165 [Alphaproteobacteria bacterium]|nr:hypothetical protein [Alphaproteobacteria bacterium]MAS46721.1 hypothetical protein [Alphaproteobacteria bacterium]MAX94816.1 hypothetical protein [Alphaproteobacteria bacterium]MBN53731.1 hypothetical protein [Alphaproteobacteria bacterium]OUT41702.1 MAG: hypothetical protein CBB62_05120 [Micavibrio sp. TMED2]